MRNRDESGSAVKLRFSRSVKFLMPDRHQPSSPLSHEQSPDLSPPTVGIGEVAVALDEMVSVQLQRDVASQVQTKTLKAVMDAAVDVMITIDPAGIVQSFNPTAERVFGYRAEEVINRNVNMLMPNPYRDEHDAYLSAYKSTGVKKVIGIGREAMGRRKDGSDFPIELAVSEVTLDGKPLFVGVVRDISERKQAQERLRTLNEELEARVRLRTMQLEDASAELVRKEKLAILGQLAGSVAHEIRNPLGVIRNSTYYLEKVSPQLDDETVAAWSEVKRALDTASRIISELLDYARDPRVNPVSIAARQVIERALASIQTPPATDVAVEVDEPGPIVFVDAGQIQQVLENLIQNAFQAMPNGGVLTLRAEAHPANQVTIEVRDTGHGIDPQDLSRIFEPLFSRKARGIGLGLPLSRRYVELNQGVIRAESQPGLGATFRLIVPRGS